MKRSGFKVSGMRPARAATQLGAGYTLRPRPVAVAVAGPARAVVAVPKDAALQNEPYMAAVRKLACYRCRIVGFSQFCHADEGKGLGIKSDCRLGWPGCGPRSNEPGCHWIVGTSGRLGRDGRRAFEAAAGKATRAEINALGQWPETLPAWPGDEAARICPRCNRGGMRPGVAMGQTVSGAPDFPGGAVVTVSPGGPGRIVPCLKCSACGFSTTLGPDAIRPVPT